MPVFTSDQQFPSPVWPVAAAPPACVHCGDVCAAPVGGEAGVFCCIGCASVYALLQARGLDAFYTCDVPAGVSQRDLKRHDSARFTVLDDPTVRPRFILSDDGRLAQARFAVPSLHCASCVWLLERLGRVDDRIGRSEVDLLRRTVTVAFDSSRLRLSEVAAAIASVGYEPLLIGETPRPATPARRRLYTQIGVAGFAFGNIMLFSIPRYANGAPIEDGFQRLFDALNVALALPVLVYSASDYFRGAWRALRHRTISLDVPIVIGLVALVGRSLVDIATGRGEGYFDSFAGLVFFLLIGRLFQQQAFDWIGFDRTFRSFFPLSVLVQAGADVAPAPLPIDRLRAGDRIVLRPGEVVPVDARLVDERAVMDYAFLTGEREPVDVRAGGLVRAGGRLTRTTARLDVVREVADSELASLWARRASPAHRSHWLTDVSARFGAWFVVVALVLAVVGAALWWPDTARALEVATAVLIIACPCALTLAAPITLGTAMTMLGRRGWYLKDPAALLDLSRVDSIVFDKTGTLTASAHTAVTVSGLTEDELARVRTLASGSVHPISRALAGSAAAAYAVASRDERIGRGLRGMVDGHDVAIGSVPFITEDCGLHQGVPASGTVVAIDGRVRGTVAVSAPVRPGLEAAVGALAATYRMSLLSGDRDAGDERWVRLFGARATFGQSAVQKREHIAALSAAGERVLMVGDGLNDAGAFEAADIGLAVSDDTACIVPACDVVVAGARLAVLPDVLLYARRARRAVLVCFVISLAYNAIGLSLALAGLLSPLVAAILMPISSLTVVGTSVGLARWWARDIPAS
jgi:Cu+-exporting ATPase